MDKQRGAMTFDDLMALAQIALDQGAVDSILKDDREICEMMARR